MQFLLFLRIQPSPVKSVYAKLIKIRVHSRPLPADSLGILLIFFVMLRNIRGERIIRVRRTKKCLYRKKYCSDLKRRRPFVFPGMHLNSVYFKIQGTHVPFKMSKQIRPSLSSTATQPT